MSTTARRVTPRRVGIAVCAGIAAGAILGPLALPDPPPPMPSAGCPEDAVTIAPGACLPADDLDPTSPLAPIAARLVAECAPGTGVIELDPDRPPEGRCDTQTAP